MDFEFILKNKLEPVKSEDQWRIGSVTDFEWVLPFLSPELVKCYQLNPVLWGPIFAKDPKELRALIRDCKKNKQPCEDLLGVFYSSCVRTDFISSLIISSLFKTDAASYVDIRELKNVSIDYSEMGYCYIGTLLKTDIKWLIDAFGEPKAHESFDSKWPTLKQNAIIRYHLKESWVIFRDYLKERSYENCTLPDGFVHKEQVHVSFMTALPKLKATKRFYLALPPKNKFSEVEFMTLALALSQMAMDGVTLSLEWALAWVSMTRLTGWGAAQGCPLEFYSLFRIRYQEKFDDGLKLELGNESILSWGTRGIYDLSIPNPPNLMALSHSSISAMYDLVNACTEELDAYNRFLWRKQNSKYSIEAMSYLPLCILKKQLDMWLCLSEVEKTRLNPQWYIPTASRMKNFENRIKLLNQDQLELLTVFLRDITKHSNIETNNSPELSNIYALLNWAIYSQTRNAGIQPVTIQTAVPGNLRGFAIPVSPKPAGSFTLNMDSIEAKLAETNTVSAILNNIFSDAEQSSVIKPLTELPSPPVSFIGLDAEAFTFMHVLASKLVWEREELEILAAEHNLMLDGTLDSINDASYGHFGSPFFEGDGRIEIDQRIVDILGVRERNNLLRSM